MALSASGFGSGGANERGSGGPGRAESGPLDVGDGGTEGRIEDGGPDGRSDDGGLEPPDEGGGSSPPWGAEGEYETRTCSALPWGSKLGLLGGASGTAVTIGASMMSASFIVIRK